MMPLDSWIDDEAREWLRALAPKPRTQAPAVPEATDAEDAFLAPTTSTAPEPEPSAPPPEPVKILRETETDPSAMRHMRDRLAEIRRRAEHSGVLRSARPSIDSPSPLPFVISSHPEVPPQAASFPDSAFPVPGTINDDFSEPLPPAEPLPAGPLPTPPDFPAGNLAIRIATLCQWLETALAMDAPVVFDKYGSALHPGHSQDPKIATALAMLDAAPQMDTPAHQDTAAGTLAVISVATIYGNLHVAAIVAAPVAPELAALLAEALRRATGLTSPPAPSPEP